MCVASVVWVCVRLVTRELVFFALPLLLLLLFRGSEENGEERFELNFNRGFLSTNWCVCVYVCMDGSVSA